MMSLRLWSAAPAAVAALANGTRGLGHWGWGIQAASHAITISANASLRAGVIALSCYVSERPRTLNATLELVNDSPCCENQARTSSSSGA